MPHLVTIAAITSSTKAEEDDLIIHVSPAATLESFLARLSKEHPGWKEVDVTIIRDAETLETLMREFPDPTAP